ncbi:hypothetical protein BpHYR1_005420 [Brachionus plicatilis]|uniref:Uncharacterized protein n=1 Tax=Brachionus plicatilis TaxID=10195 RepID=A0A3M7QGM4_BRAPC|nr:hypothetical protein BpHYR1_005420 [Brachionus plicatilis]
MFERLFSQFCPFIHSSLFWTMNSRLSSTPSKKSSSFKLDALNRVVTVLCPRRSEANLSASAIISAQSLSSRTGSIAGFRKPREKFLFVDNLISTPCYATSYYILKNNSLLFRAFY